MRLETLIARASEKFWAQSAVWETLGDTVAYTALLAAIETVDQQVRKVDEAADLCAKISRKSGIRMSKVGELAPEDSKTVLEYLNKLIQGALEQLLLQDVNIKREQQKRIKKYS